MRPLTMLVLVLLLPLPSVAQDRFARATTIGSVDSIWSATLQESRPYLVHTPPTYDDTASNPRGYPVLYLLDGGAHFHSVSGLLQILGTGVNGTWVLPEMIVVAIPNTNRLRDMTPTHTEVGFDGEPAPELKTSGGMPAFLTFLRTELIPHIESRYRTMPYRIFVGHSLGGITTLNALYTIPETFNAYVAIDPSLWWDNRVLLRQARDYFSTARLNGRALYVAQANTVNPADTTRNLHFESITRFDAIMRAYDDSGLRYAFRYYDHDDHGSVPLIAEYDALRFIFDGYGVSMPLVADRPAALREHFRHVSDRLGTTFDPPWGMLRLLAQFTLGQDTAKAIEFGEMGVEYYPDNYRAWELAGDMWAARDSTTKALEYYEQALLKNPGNARVTEKVRKLKR